MQANDQFIREAVHMHHLFHMGGFVSEVIEKPNMRLVYVERFNNIWYNSANDIRIKEHEVDDMVHQVEEFFTSRDRTPSIYVSPVTKPSNLGELLEVRGYKKVESEVWMFHDFSKPRKSYTCPPEIVIHNAQTDADLADFADVYRQSLPSADMEEKIQSCIAAFKSGPPLIQIQYFMAKYQGEPAAMLTSLRLGDYCGLYSGATVEKFQGKGIMRALMDHATTLAETTGVKCLLFNSVSGTKGVVVYPKLGYIPLFSRDCYVPADSIGAL